MDCDEESSGDEEEEEEYDMKAIHEERRKGAKLEYRIEWEGYAEHTWEPASCIQGGEANTVLEVWLAAKRAAPPPAPKPPNEAQPKPQPTIAKKSKKKK